MSSGLAGLPVEPLEQPAASTSAAERLNTAFGVTVTPPTPAVVSNESDQHSQKHLVGADNVPANFQDLEDAMGSEDGWSISGVDSDEFEEEEADGGQSEEMRALMEEAKNAWSDDEVEQMMDDLREIGMLSWLKKYYIREQIPVRKLLMAFGLIVPFSGDPSEEGPDLLRVLKLAISRVLRKRYKRTDVNTIDDVVKLIDESKNILVLSGAGVSTSCGIPDFRSSDGIYANLRRTRPDLTDPQEMFDIHTFKRDPTLFYSFARELYPSNFEPSPSHHFVKLLETKHKLLRNYSQNIDTLEQKAGLQRVLNCHGSFAEAECIICKQRFPGDSIKENIFAGQVPLCQVCTSTPEYQVKAADKAARLQPKPAKRQKFSAAWDAPDDEAEDNIDEDLERWRGEPLVKPTITFFGEALSDDFDKSLFSDRDVVDLVLVMGTSLRVAPVSELLGHLPHSTPQILINRDPVPHHQFDVCLLGDSDAVVQHLCDRLNGLKAHAPAKSWILPGETSSSDQEPRRLGDSHVFLLKGANDSHRWLQQFDPAWIQRRSEGGLGLPGSRRSKSPSSPDSSRIRSRSRSRSVTSDTGSGNPEAPPIKRSRTSSPTI